MNNSDKYEYDEYGYIIETGDCVAIPVEKLNTAPPNPLACEITEEEEIEILKKSTIIIQMDDPGSRHESIKTESTENH